MSETRIWEEYYEYAGIVRQDVRAGCEPRLIISKDCQNAIVLIHGLADSPFFMDAIGQYFHHTLGFNVFIPLLAGHGLKQPHNHKKATAEQWISNVDFAIQQAQASGENVTVSIGGLSAGGTLSVYQALFEPDRISGGVYLFSAALKLAEQYSHFQDFVLAGKPIELLIETLGETTPLVGANPYRYTRVAIEAAAQLLGLIQIINRKLETAALQQPTFISHSEADDTVDIRGMEMLSEKSTIVEFFRLQQHVSVPHASVVLKNDIVAEDGSLLEPENPFFHKMMDALHRFTKQHLNVI